MKGKLRDAASRDHKVFLKVLPPLFVSLAMWQVFAPTMSRFRVTMAFILLLIPWLSHLEWKENPTTKIPVFAMVAFMHWLYFGAPLYWGEIRGGFFTVRRISGDAIDTAALIAVAGVVSLWIGMRLVSAGPRVRALPDVKMDRPSLTYMRVAMVAGVVMSGFTDLVYFAGEELRQVFIILQTVVPATVFAVFFRAWLRDEATRTDQYLAFGYVAVQALLGLASGWTGSAVYAVMLCGIVYFAERRKLPVRALVVLIPIFMFLQVGKGVFRKNFWYRKAEGNVTEKVEFWLNASRTQWDFAMQNEGSQGMGAMILGSLDRVSLTAQAGGVVEKTPDVVPYQNGKTYSYIPIALIPRFFWPDKPSVNEANRFYQVAYGLSRERELANVSIAVGYLMESYINFGWYGVFGVMCLVGWVLGKFEQTFFSAQSGTLMASLGFVLMISFLTIESQMAQYLGGIVQRIVLTLLVFLPITNQRGRSLAREAAMTTRTPVFR